MHLPPLLPNTFYVHQTWKNTEIPEKWQRSRQLYEHFATQVAAIYILWTDDMNRRLIQESFPWFLQKFDAYPKNIQRADAARYFILHKYGGLYSDLDIEPDVELLGNYLEFIRKDTHGPKVYLGATELIVRDQPYTNAFMLSLTPGHPFWERTWYYLMNPYCRKTYKKFLAWLFPNHFPIIYETGPGIVSDAAADVPVQAIPAAFMNHKTIRWDASSPLLRHTQGSSWCEKQDLKNLRNMQKLWQARDYYLIPLVILMTTLFVTFLILYLRK